MLFDSPLPDFLAPHCPSMVTSWQQLKESLAEVISTRCFSVKSLRCLHAHAITSSLHHNLFISILLIEKYFAYGSAATARLIFDCHHGRRQKPLLWNSLIRGYLRCQLPQLALDVFREMTTSSSSECELDKHTFHLAITACTRLSEFDLGFMIGNRARNQGLHSDLLVATSSIVLYVKACEVELARMVFDEMSVRDVVSWNAMISGYSQSGLLSEAMELFRNMRAIEGVCISEGSFVSLVSCCGNEGCLRNGEALHALVIITGFGSNLFVSNSLLEMYAECNHLMVMVQLFDGMILKDSISWGTMIGGYVKNGQPSEALKVLHEMLSNTKVLPTHPILLNALLACASLGDLETGKWIQKKYLSSSDDEMSSDSAMITTLIYMYARCRNADIAFQFLETNALVKDDVIAWNAMIKACVEIGDFQQVFGLSLKMQRKGIHLDRASFLMLLSVISTNFLPRKGAETHALIVKRGFESERTVMNSLIDMYAQFGSLEGSYKIFECIQGKDVISWSIMIKSCVWNGNAKEAFDHFALMREKEIRPNHFTFLALLSACSHGGLVEKGNAFFASMEKYGLKPDIKHFTCMIDLFCRAGLLNDAYHLLKDMMLEDNTSIVLWGALLSACRVHGNLVIGEAAASHLFLLEPGNVANYLMLADIYIFNGKIEDSNALFRLLKEKGLEKMPSFSRFDAR